jgi:hypothetical protein
VDDLVDDNHGTRGVTVRLPYGEEIAFRYLGLGDFWFDEAGADEITDQGFVIDAIEPPQARTSDHDGVPGRSGVCMQVGGGLPVASG